VSVLNGVQMNDKANAFWYVFSPAAPVFLADIDRDRGMLRLHVRRGLDVRAVHECARAFLETQDRDLVVTVEQHRRKDLTLPRSLEHWLSKLAPGEVVYDPTLVVARARYLIDVSRRVRLALGRRVKGVFFDYARNQLVVVVRPVGDRAEATTIVQRAVAEASRDVEASALGTSQVGASFKIVSERPAHELVPVDGLSISLLGGLRRLARQALASVAMAVAGLAAIGPAAASTGSRSAPPPADTAQLGVLLGLSLLSDASSRPGADAFAAAALEMYFGRSAAAEKAMQLAQAQQTTTETPNQDPNQTTTEASPGS
jgi:hypothetical protein